MKNDNRDQKVSIIVLRVITNLLAARWQQGEILAAIFGGFGSMGEGAKNRQKPHLSFACSSARSHNHGFLTLFYLSSQTFMRVVRLLAPLFLSGDRVVRLLAPVWRGRRAVPNQVESGAFSILLGNAQCRNGAIQQNKHYSRKRVTPTDVIDDF